MIGATADVSAPTDSSERVQTVKSIAKDRIGAGYFAALDAPLLEGREFDERDQRVEVGADTRSNGSKGVSSPSVALPIILNQSAARGLFGNANPVGQRVTEGARAYEIIGVIHDLKTGMPSGDSPSVIYLPLTRRDFARPPPGGMTIMVRANASAAGSSGMDAMAGIRHEIAAIDPNLAVFDVRTLGEYLDISKTYTRIATTMYGGIGVFGLILAAIGLAGVTAYSVARRRKEIGIRMALGSSKGQVLRLVLREGIVLVTVGTALGFLGAMGMAKGLSALTSMFTEAFQSGTDDPRLLIGAPLLLAGLALLACYIPARRSAKIDPLTALREE
jgi:ABC-type antimicrobial peptide transport system permease subunit